MPLCMRLPQGFRCDRMSRKTHALKLVRNVYGQKQAGRVWNKYMDQGMKEIGSSRVPLIHVYTTEGASSF